MTSDYHRIILLFVDGVGLDRAVESNPWAQVHTPGIDHLLGGPMTLEQCGLAKNTLLVAIDASLGLPGLPQSATGQAALFTGVNAAELMGRHITGLPGPRVRSLVEASNLFSRATESGHASTFANAYTPAYLESVAAGRHRPSVTTCAVAAAGLEFRQLSDLRNGQAVSWDILRDRFAVHVDGDLPLISASEAGRHLAAIGSRHRLTVFETFVTDMAGHGRRGFVATDAVSRIDGLLEGLTEGLDPSTTVVMTSDHGNIEDGSHRRHTANPVPLLVVGPLAREFADVASILEVTPRILACLKSKR